MCAPSGTRHFPGLTRATLTTPQGLINVTLEAPPLLRWGTALLRFDESVGSSIDSPTSAEVESMRNITTEPAGKVAPADGESQQPAPTKPEPTIVSCHPQRGWIVVEGVL